MKGEREIRVGMDPHEWDNLNNPYFWVVMEFSGSGWCNSGLYGWAKTPQDAWNDAYTAWQTDSLEHLLEEN